MTEVAIFLLTTLLLSQLTSWASSETAKEKHKTGFVPGIEMGEQQRKSGFIDGDFIVGVLLPVHEKPLLKGGTDPLVCGEIHDKIGIQRVEAAFFAIDSINRDNSILPGIKLGVNIKDGCESESVTLHQTIKLIEDPVPVTDEQKKLKGTCSVADFESPLVGIIGPSTASTTIIVQNMLKLFQIPQIGYSVTTTTLTDNLLYNYLLRMVPNDEYQVQIMFRFLITFEWSYISVLHTSGEYGQSGANLIHQYAHGSDICIAATTSVPNYDDQWAYDEALRKLSQKKRAKVVICFCENETVKNLLKAVRRNNLTGEFLFIGSDLWTNTISLVEDYYKEAAVGSFSLAIKPTPDEEFDDYFFKKNLTNNKRNPWFEEFWQHRFRCALNSTSNPDLPPCTGEEDMSKNHHQDLKIPYIIKAIYAMAHGLDKMHSDVCKNVTLCPEFYPFNSSNFMEYLKNINFTYRNEPVSFTSSGGPWHFSYNIYNFQKLENGSYSHKRIGIYDSNYDELVHNSTHEEDEDDFFDNVIEKVQFPRGKTGKWKSVCSDPCLPGQIESIRSGGQQCCWDCSQCPVGKIPSNLTHCTSCPWRHWPNSDQTKCIEVPMTYIQWQDIQSVISLSISCIGITLTIASAIIFLKYRETPVVKSSTRELCYMMLVGMIMAHCISFAIIAEPSLISCTIVRTMPPISFTIIYAALLVKTNRIARILAISKKKFPNLNPRFMSLKAQITITLILVAIETALCAVTLIREPSSPKTRELKVENQLYVNLICPISNEAILIPFSFVVFLVIMCTSYAVKTRNLPDNFNEAKFIGFSMYVTCITWLAFGLIYYGSNLQVITTCVCASTNSLVILIFLFFPKLYIILCAPKKNTRANFTTSKGIRCTIGRGDMSQSENTKKLLETDFTHIPNFSSQKR